MPQELTSVDDISTRLGSYGLLIELSKDFSLSRPRFYGAVFKRGQYLYAGSAFGPSGIRGRVRYHLNQPKPAERFGATHDQIDVSRLWIDDR